MIASLSAGLIAWDQLASFVALLLVRSYHYYTFQLSVYYWANFCDNTLLLTLDALIDLSMEVKADIVKG
jgi:hypothetical protein